MALQSMLFSNDPAVLNALPMMLKDSGVSVDVLSRETARLDPITTQKIDSVFVDFGIASAPEIVRSARNNAKGPIIAVAIAKDSEETRRAFQSGATLVLAKPLSKDKVMSGVRVSHSFMVQERRRTMRFPLQTPISLRFGAGRWSNGIGLNVNVGGLGFRMEELPKVDDFGDLRFTLPGSRAEIKARIQVRWVDCDKKTGGVRFVSLSQEMPLKQWIADRCEDSLVSDRVAPTIAHKN
jgi:CheY-like chemotaxis protein